MTLTDIQPELAGWAQLRRADRHRDRRVLKGGSGDNLLDAVGFSGDKNHLIGVGGNDTLKGGFRQRHAQRPLGCRHSMTGGDGDRHAQGDA